VPSAAVQARLAANLRERIASRGLSLDTAADLAGVSRRQLYSVLSGDRDATVGWLEKLADVLEVDVAELLKPRPESDT
jgi:predicted transcriptional regulator